jgi:sugar/nucleoside kinase (ribokinase family)
MWDAVIAGHICLDVIPDLSTTAGASFDQLFQPGRLVEVGPVLFSTGGPVANTGLAMQRLGMAIQLMGKVGDDLYGGAVRRLVSAVDPHLADGMIVDPAAQTSYTIVVNPPGIDRIFLHFAGANNTFRADDVRYDVVAQSRMFHFGYPPIMRSMFENEGRELVEIFRRAKATGVTTSLDMSLPDPSSASGRADWRSILQATLPYVDIFQPSGEELLFMLDRERSLQLRAMGGDVLYRFTPALLHEMSDEALGLGARVVVIKLGHRGIYLRTGSRTALAAMGRGQVPDPAAWANKELWAPAFKVREVGATGSGDSAISGFLTAVLRGLSAEACAIMATAVGACNVEAADALSGIRPWSETEQRIAAGWSKHELGIVEPSWEFDDRRQIWIKR